MSLATGWMKENFGEYDQRGSSEKLFDEGLASRLGLSFPSEFVIDNGDG